MNELKQSEVVKLITVTLTRLLEEVELVDLQLVSVEILNDVCVVAKIKLNNTCLSTITDNNFTVTLEFNELKAAMSVSANRFLVVLQEKVGAALLKKGKNHGT